MQKFELKEIILSQKERYLPKNAWVNRSAYTELSQYLGHPHALIVKGVRRCGKSTLLNQLLYQQAMDQYYYLNFEDERLLSFTVADFAQLHEVFIELYGERQIFYFDEIQNIEQWEMFVRRMQDSGFKFYLTGSNASLLSKEMGTKLTGRHIDIELFPFSFQEFLLFKQVDYNEESFYDVKSRGLLRQLFNIYLQHGGMPEYLHFQQPELLVQVYEDILFRDVITRYEIKDIKALRELSLYLITNMARPFSFNKLKHLSGIGSTNTVKAYVGYLEDCYLLFSINQFSYSLNNQMSSNKKVYVIDNGLANAIAFQFSRNLGQYLENLVFLELKRQKKQVFYYKTQNNLEVDFLLRKGREIEGLIQVAYDLGQVETKNREIKALVKAMQELNVEEGLILTDEHQEELVIENKKIAIKPIYQWLLEGVLR